MEGHDFYEREEAVHEVLEAKRSEVSYNILMNLLTEKKNSEERKRVLDIGCGDGSFIVKFERYCEVVGVDVSWKAVQMAKGAGIDAHKLDVSQEKLPFANAHFDAIYMGDIIEHLMNPDFAMNEASRVLKTNGYLVLSTPNLAAWTNRILLLLGIQPLFTEVSTVSTFRRITNKSCSFPVGHLRIFTYRTLIDFLTYHGFRIMKASGAPFENYSNVLNLIDRAFSTIPSLASIIIIVTRKNKRDTA